MDADKDGIINKSDLRSTFNQIGKLVTEKELDEMVSEAPGPINFTQMLTLFANRMSGQADEDEVVIAAFKTFDQEGQIDGERYVDVHSDVEGFRDLLKQLLTSIYPTKVS